MNDINNNVNFTARMDVKQVLDTQRWKNISKIFRQTTKEYPHDTFHLTEYLDRIEAIGINSKTGNEIEAQFNFENIAKLLKNLKKCLTFPLINKEFMMQQKHTQKNFLY